MIEPFEIEPGSGRFIINHNGRSFSVFNNMRALYLQNYYAVLVRDNQNHICVYLGGAIVSPPSKEILVQIARFGHPLPIEEATVHFPDLPRYIESEGLRYGE